MENGFLIYLIKRRSKISLSRGFILEVALVMYFILNREVFKGQRMLVFSKFIGTGGKLQRQVKMQEICSTVWMMDPENIL